MPEGAPGDLGPARDAARVRVELDRHLERFQANVTRLFEARAAAASPPA